MRKIVLALSLCLISLTSFANSITESYAQLVYTRYQDALNGALALQKSVDAFLATPTATQLDTVKQAWITARIPYLKTEAYRFYGGPIDGEKGPEERINAWPLNEAYIDYIVLKETIPITPEFLKEKNQQKDEKDVTTGWHAIEFLLWGQNLSATGPGARPASDYAKGNKITERRRAYLKYATDLLVEDLRYLTQAWEPGKNNYAAQFKKLKEQEALGKILTGIASLSVAELALERMNNALISGERLDQQSCFSDTTHQDFIYNAKGIRDVYHLLSETVAKKNPELDKTIQARLDETDRRIAAIPNPYGPVLSTPKESPEKKAVSATVQSLQEQGNLFKKAGEVLAVKVDIVLK